MSSSLLTIPERDPILFAGIAATLILAAAFAFQLAGYHPCEMCWWQRYPYMAIIAIAVIANALPTLPRKPILLLLALLFAVDAGLAGFHAGVEQGWWEGITTCTASIDPNASLEDALKALDNAPLIRCDEIAWSLFGVSMAGYNFILATAMTLFCLRRYRNS